MPSVLVINFVCLVAKDRVDGWGGCSRWVLFLRILVWWGGGLLSIPRLCPSSVFGTLYFGLTASPGVWTGMSYLPFWRSYSGLF